MGLGAVTNSIKRTDAFANLDDRPSKPTSAVNYLIVGSDSREGLTRAEQRRLRTGSTKVAAGKRSDTILLVHISKNRDRASIVSIPRDSYALIPRWTDGQGKVHSETHSKINSAFAWGGAPLLIQTLESMSDLRIDHYIEVDFASFKNIVNALGGVDICFEYPTRDINTGLNVPAPGCYTLDQYQSLAYARSRYYEVFRDGAWDVDGRADLGRIERQQIFLQAAISKAIEQTTANPMRSSELINAAVNSLTVDPSLNLIETADYLKPLASGGVQRYSLSVVPEMVNSKDVLVLGAEAGAVLAYFAGTAGPPPVG